MSAPIPPLTSLQRPVFLLNSRLGHFTAPRCNRGPLLPKLRGNFAEFLNEGSLDHLRILILTYQCRFSVRALTPSNGAFLDSLGSVKSPQVSPQLPPLLTPINRGYDWGRTMSNRHAPPTFLCPPTPIWSGRCWNNNQLSIAYASRPRLRPD